MVPDLGSSRGESTTSKIGFYPGNVKERLARGTQQTTRLMVGYEIMKVSRKLKCLHLIKCSVISEKMHFFCVTTKNAKHVHY